MDGGDRLLHRIQSPDAATGQLSLVARRAGFQHHRFPVAAGAPGQLNAVARRAGFHARLEAVSEKLRLNQAAARIRVRSVLSVHGGPTLSAPRAGSGA